MNKALEEMSKWFHRMEVFRDHMGKADPPHALSYEEFNVLVTAGRMYFDALEEKITQLPVILTGDIADLWEDSKWKGKGK